MQMLLEMVDYASDFDIAHDFEEGEYQIEYDDLKDNWNLIEKLTEKNVENHCKALEAEGIYVYTIFKVTYEDM